MLEELERNISSIGLNYVSQSMYLYVTCGVDLLNNKKIFFLSLKSFQKPAFSRCMLSSMIDRYLLIELRNPSNASWNEQVITVQKCISTFLVIFFDWRQKEVGKMIRVRFPLYTIKPKAYFSNRAHWSKSL